MVKKDIDKVIFALRYIKLLMKSYYRIVSSNLDIQEIRKEYAVNEENDEDIYDEYMNRPIASMFSDSIVITQEFDSEFSFSYFITIIAEIQYKLLTKGILVRGAIDIGKIYHDDAFVFGDGLISAYLLESTTSRFPRIIISERALKKVKNLIDELFENEFNHYFSVGNEKYWIPSKEEKLEPYFNNTGIKLLSYDEFNISYIDYIRHGFHGMVCGNYEEDNENYNEYGYQFDSKLSDQQIIEYGFEIYASEIDNIKNFITNGISNNIGNIQEKYIWLKNSYNRNLTIVFNSYVGKFEKKSIEIKCLEELKKYFIE